MSLKNMSINFKTMLIVAAAALGMIVIFSVSLESDSKVFI